MIENIYNVVDFRGTRNFEGSYSWTTKENVSNAGVKNFEALSDEYIIIKFLNGDILHVRGPAEQIFLPDIHADIMVLYL